MLFILRLFYKKGYQSLKCKIRPLLRSLEHNECIDIDECLEKSHNCLAPFTCHNTPGSFGQI